MRRWGWGGCRDASLEILPIHLEHSGKHVEVFAPGLLRATPLVVMFIKYISGCRCFILKQVRVVVVLILITWLDHRQTIRTIFYGRGLSLHQASVIVALRQLNITTFCCNLVIIKSNHFISQKPTLKSPLVDFKQR